MRPDLEPGSIRAQLSSRVTKTLPAAARSWLSSAQRRGARRAPQLATLCVLEQDRDGDARRDGLDRDGESAAAGDVERVRVAIEDGGDRAFDALEVEGAVPRPRSSGRGAPRAAAHRIVVRELVRFVAWEPASAAARLARYVARPAIALDRLSLGADGRVVFRWRVLSLAGLRPCARRSVS